MSFSRWGCGVKEGGRESHGMMGIEWNPSENQSGGVEEKEILPNGCSLVAKGF